MEVDLSELFDQDRTDLYHKLGALYERVNDVGWPMIWKAGTKLRDEGSLLTDAAVLQLAREYEQRVSAYMEWTLTRARERRERRQDAPVDQPSE